MRKRETLLSWRLRFAAVHQRVLRPIITCILPVRIVGIVVSRRVVLDVLCGLVAGRIARDHFGALLLVPADVVDAHDGREVERGVIDVDPVLGDTKVDDYRHWFFGDEALADVAVGSDGAAVELHHFVVADEPLDVGVFVSARGVFEGVFLILHTIVPRVVEHSGSGDGLLERTTSVSVDETEAIVWSLHEIVVGVPIDIERCNLERLGGDGNPHAGPITTDFNNVDFGGATTRSRCRVVSTFAATRRETLTRQVA